MSRARGRSQGTASVGLRDLRYKWCDLEQYLHGIHRRQYNVTTSSCTWVAGRQQTYTKQFLVLHNLKLVRRLNSIKYFPASSRMTWLSGEWTSVSRTISVLVIQELTPWRWERNGPWNAWFTRHSTTWRGC